MEKDDDARRRKRRLLSNLRVTLLYPNRHKLPLVQNLIDS